MKHSIVSSSLTGLLGLTLAAFGMSTLGQRTEVRYEPSLSKLESSLTSVREELKALHVSAGDDLVPFAVEIPGGLANSAFVGSANPRIAVDSDGSDGWFVITSMMFKTNVPLTGFQALSANSVTIDGTLYDTRTHNLVTVVGSGVNESADLMGAPIRAGLSSADAPTAGNFPTQIVARSAGIKDVEVLLFARSDDSDLSIQSVRVSGWKRRGDAISVKYLAGS